MKDHPQSTFLLEGKVISAQQSCFITEYDVSLILWPQPATHTHSWSKNIKFTNSYSSSDEITTNKIIKGHGERKTRGQNSLWANPCLVTSTQ